MISITPYGRKQFQNSIQRLPATIHLYVESGELEGYGYQPKMFRVSEWADGRYPEFMWEFSSESSPAFVLGYYVSDSSGQVLFSKQFEESYKIQNQGDRIGVAVTMNFIGAIGNT